MRWIWLDRILTLEKGARCVAIKNVSAAEDVLHDHFPAVRDPKHPARNREAFPVLPNTLVIEGFAQCAGILVGHARDFREKVLLAKVGKAEFNPGLSAGPGTTLRYTAVADRIDAAGAMTAGTVELIDSATGSAREFAKIEMMFSHIDQNMKGLEFPDENFVFTDQFMDLLRRSGVKLDHLA